jgi:hypothetical protein
MFHRVLYESWHQIIPVLAMAATGCFFIVAVLRALLMKKERADRAAHLPLVPDAPPAPSPHESSEKITPF